VHTNNKRSVKADQCPTFMNYIPNFLQFHSGSIF